MKEESPLYLVLARKEFDWNILPGAKEYNVGLEKKKLAPGNEKMADWTWKGDKAEKARRIWEYWVVHRERFCYFKLAVRLVALVQVSSTSVERVFTQLKLILETAQQSALHDIIELRLFEKQNLKYYI